MNAFETSFVDPFREGLVDDVTAVHAIKREPLYYDVYTCEKSLNFQRRRKYNDFFSNDVLSVKDN